MAVFLGTSARYNEIEQPHAQIFAAATSSLLPLTQIVHVGLRVESFSFFFQIIGARFAGVFVETWRLGGEATSPRVPPGLLRRRER